MTFTVLLTGLVTGIALMPVFLAGVPVLAGTLWAACDRRTPSGPGSPSCLARTSRPRRCRADGAGCAGMWAPLTSAAAWRGALYGLIRFPLSMLQFVLVTGWSLGRR